MTDASRPPPPDHDGRDAASRELGRWIGEGLTLVQRGKRLLLPDRPVEEPSLPYRAWLLVVYTVRRWWSIDACPTLASSLTLQTLFSVVPLVGLFLFLVRLVDVDTGIQLVTYIAATLVPHTERASEVAQQVTLLASNVRLEQIGIFGFFGALALAYWSFSSLEHACNVIWRVTRQRKLVAKFTMFYTVASLGPLLLLYSFAHPAMVEVRSALPILPFVATSAALVLLNRTVPFTDVRWSAALLAGVVSAFLFELGKYGFGIYVSRVAMSAYEGLYGPLAILPMFLLWTYVSWLIVLFGVELCFVIHHHRMISRLGWVDPAHRNEQRPQAAPGRTAARLMLAIADHWSRREKGTSIEALDERFDLGLATIGTMVDALETAGYVLPVEGGGFVPARPLEQIRLSEVLDLFGTDIARVRSDELARVFTELDTQRDAHTQDLTFAELVRAERRAAQQRITASAGGPAPAGAQTPTDALSQTSRSLPPSPAPPDASADAAPDAE
jgi:membrane protein